MFFANGMIGAGCDCGNGRMGRFDGMIVYCTCARGASAELDDMSKRLQTMAAELARLDALDRLGRLTPFTRIQRDTIADGFLILTAQHDALENSWAALRLVPA